MLFYCCLRGLDCLEYLEYLDNLEHLDCLDLRLLASELEASLHAIIAASEGTDSAVVALADVCEEVERLGAVEAEAHIVTTDGNVCLEALACRSYQGEGLAGLIKGIGTRVRTGAKGIGYITAVVECEINATRTDAYHLVEGSELVLNCSSCYRTACLGKEILALELNSWLVVRP